MAEGLLGGVLGGEAEEKAASTKAGTEAFAAAVAANIGNQSPEVAAETAAFFREQTQLVKAQRKTVEAEHEFFEAEWGPRLLGIRLRVGFQIFVALFTTVIGIAFVIHDAVKSRNVNLFAREFSDERKEGAHGIRLGSALCSPRGKENQLWANGSRARQS